MRRRPTASSPSSSRWASKLVAPSTVIVFHPSRGPMSTVEPARRVCCVLAAGVQQRLLQARGLPAAGRRTADYYGRYYGNRQSNAGQPPTNRLACRCSAAPTSSRMIRCTRRSWPVWCTGCWGVCCMRTASWTGVCACACVRACVRAVPVFSIVALLHSKSLCSPTPRALLNSKVGVVSLSRFALALSPTTLCAQPPVPPPPGEGHEGCEDHRRRRRGVCAPGC